MNEFIDMMRRTTAAPIRIVLSNADQPIVPRNDKRVALIISADEANDIAINFGTAAVLTEGVLLKSGVGPLILSISTTGLACQQEIHGISSGACTITVVEVLASLD